MNLHESGRTVCGRSWSLHPTHLPVQRGDRGPQTSRPAASPSQAVRPEGVTGFKDDGGRALRVIPAVWVSVVRNVFNCFTGQRHARQNQAARGKTGSLTLIGTCQNRVQVPAASSRGVLPVAAQRQSQSAAPAPVERAVPWTAAPGRCPVCLVPEQQLEAAGRAVPQAQGHPGMGGQRERP